jgi:hypothetical protein
MLKKRLANSEQIGVDSDVGGSVYIAEGNTPQVIVSFMKENSYWKTCKTPHMTYDFYVWSL